MKFSLLFLLNTAALVAQTTVVHPNGWVLGTEFPAPPLESTKRMSSTRGEVVDTSFVHEIAGKEGFALSRARHPGGFPADRLDEIYDGAKEGMLRARPGILISEERIMIGGHEGRRYLVARDDGRRRSDHRLVIIGSELNQFMYERFADEKDSPEATRFFARLAKKSE